MTENAHRVEEKNAQVQQEVQTLGEVSSELLSHQQRLYHQMKNLILDANPNQASDKSLAYQTP